MMISWQQSLLLILLSRLFGSVISFCPTGSSRNLPCRCFDPALYSTMNDESRTADSKRFDEEDELNATLSKIVSPVLYQLYPELVQYQKQYGHANIPLGSEAGRKCQTLRRLRVQEKLTPSDIELLEGQLQFTWHSFEDVYMQQKEHFDDFISRLREYQAAHAGDVSPPKKYPADPELGAWVTAVRRLYSTGAVDEAHVQALDALGFQWNSPRKCGSKFMQQYRSIQDRIELGEKMSTILSDPTVTSWLKAQQLANLSETRKHYMTLVFGDDWMDFGK